MIKYCHICEKRTNHTKEYPADEVVRRVFAGIITMGMSELAAEKTIICDKCGHETSYF